MFVCILVCIRARVRLSLVRERRSCVSAAKWASACTPSSVCVCV